MSAVTLSEVGMGAERYEDGCVGMPSWFTISQFLKWNWGGLRNEGLFLKRRR